MDEAKSQAEGPSRRTTMLPRITSIKSFTKPMEHLPRQDSRKIVGQSTVLAENQAPAVRQDAQNKAGTMLPPSKLQPNASMRPSVSLGQTRPKIDSAKIGQIPRAPSTGRKSSQDRANGTYSSQYLGDISQPRPQVSINSGGSGSQSNARRDYHGRSLSHQVRPTDPLHPKALPQRQSSMKNPAPESSAVLQHFSQKKGIQADPSTLSSKRTSKDAIPSSDIFHLQMELAQLHLLHRSVLPVQVQWEKSARRGFEHRFNALYERHIELKEVAHQQQTLIDQLSLVQWSRGRSGAQIAEKVQLLSHKVSDICDLLDSEGSYTHTLEIFESWFSQALRIRGQREPNDRRTVRDLDFIEGIGDGWKAEAMVLEREMNYAARDLDSFGEVSSNSSLFRILSMYRKLLVGLLEELDLIQWIENEILSQETLWIENTIHDLASDVSDNIDSMDLGRKAS